MQNAENPTDRPYLDRRWCKGEFTRGVVEIGVFSIGASRGALDGVATLKVRKGTFNALNQGSGALGKLK